MLRLPFSTIVVIRGAFDVPVFGTCIFSFFVMVVHIAVVIATMVAFALAVDLYVVIVTISLCLTN